ncbi:e9imm peptide [Bacillus sp. S4]|uniref:e9imm peptide n=1 Tax=Bacillus sp. S4 TaxID=125884 RepID=UPI001E43CB58|nr:MULTISPECIES: e9imm peptide [Bacillus cereus group]MCQ6356988.1 e9imm peptide [Bacillus cereus]
MVVLNKGSEELDEKKLLKLILEIQELQDFGEDFEHKLILFENSVPYPNAKELFFADYGAEYIVKRAINHKNIKLGELNKEELVTLVQKLMDTEGEEWEQAIWLDMVESSVIDPKIGDYIFWGDDELTAREIIDKALAYKPLKL